MKFTDEKITDAIDALTVLADDGCTFPEIKILLEKLNAESEKIQAGIPAERRIKK